MCPAAAAAAAAAAARSPASHVYRRDSSSGYLVTASLFRRRRRRGSGSGPAPGSDVYLTSYTTRDGDTPGAKLRRILSEAVDAARDLRYSVSVDPIDGRVIFSCRRSSLVFVANAFAFGLGLAVSVRVLVWLWFRFLRRRGAGSDALVVRRDRSLGGREVVVAVEKEKGKVKFRNALVNPLSPLLEASGRTRGLRSKVDTGSRELPEWWPNVTREELSPSMLVDGTKREVMQREANRLVREIIDNRVDGKDYTVNDIIQLRQTCKDYGVKATFDTANVRDTFYRAATGFVLDACSRSVQNMKDVQINDEDVKVFLAGIAENIGLDKFRAATLIRAAVAARTRAGFLQAWAMEVQKNHTEAFEELLKICRIHSVFPPEEDSAEMEMVAGGLVKSLKMDEREHMLFMYRSICKEGNHRGAAEALGLSIQ